MKQNTCRFTSYAAMAAGESLLLPQHIERLVGLMYLRTGSGLLTLENGPPITLGVKSVLLYPGWQRQRIAAHEDVGVLLLSFRCEKPEDVLDDWEKGGYIRDCHEFRDSQWILRQFDALLPGCSPSPDTKTASQLLAVLLGQIRQENGDVPPYIQRAREIIDTQFAEDLTLEVLSTLVGRSKFHLSRAFQDFYQISLNAYLNSVRLSHAVRLLTETDLPVKEIGRQVGIGNSTYFTSLFKQYYGSSPREYRLRSRGYEKK